MKGYTTNIEKETLSSDLEDLQASSSMEDYLAKRWKEQDVQTKIKQKPMDKIFSNSTSNKQKMVLIYEIMKTPEL